MGPAPKPASKRARTNATIGMTQLPWAGRKGRAPAWPLSDDLDIVVARDMAKRDADEAKEDLDLLAETGELAEMAPADRRKLQNAYERLRHRHLMLDAKIEAQKELQLALWKDLWKTPQATQWQKLSWTRDVAQYVRHKVLAELGSLDDAKEARQMADRLGLTPLSLLRLRWEIEAKPETAAAARRSTGSGGSARARRGPLVAVPDLVAESPAPTE
jgi:hypothetical protein